MTDSKVFTSIRNENGYKTTLDFNKLKGLSSEYFSKPVELIFKGDYKKIFSNENINPEIDFEFDKTHSDKVLYRTNDGQIKIEDNTYIEEHNNLKLLTKSPFSWDEYDIFYRNATRFLLGMPILDIFSHTESSTVFFPSERGAISLFAFEIIQKKAKRADMGMEFFSKQNTNLYNYPQSVNDFIYFISNLKNYVNNKGEFEKIGKTLENYTSGKISLGQFHEIRFTPENNKDSIDLNSSSSTVKSLSSIVYYFKHIAKRGDIIFIDEPELNLHPDNQRKIARVLAKAANMGIKVILSTHSDFIIKEFNNLIMLNNGKNKKDKTSLLKKYGYDKDMVLSPENVGAYLFLKDEVKELEVAETGMSVETINKEIDELDGSTEDIFYHLFQKK